NVILPPADSADKDVSPEISIPSTNATELLDSLEVLRNCYLKETNKLDTGSDDVGNSYPLPYIHLDKLQRSIADMEMDLKAKYFLFYEVMSSFNHSTNNAHGPGEAFSVLVNTLHELPERIREILFDYLNFG
ncbi:hypothetical protein OSTOST_24433, partial [Ostertagia ostertagi]